MKLEEDFFLELEKSSLLKLTEEERVKAKKELENMLTKFQVLEAFDDKNIEPFYCNDEFFNVFRSDENIESDKELEFKRSLLMEQDFFKVLRTFD